VLGLSEKQAAFLKELQSYEAHQLSLILAIYAFSLADVGSNENYHFLLPILKQRIEALVAARADLKLPKEYLSLVEL
jgi:hypothetical protein